MHGNDDIELPISILYVDVQSFLELNTRIYEFP
jgi:hypothetical protein